MQLKDDLELEYTAGSIDSLNIYNQALHSYLGNRTTTMPLLESLLADDLMPMALIMRTYLLKLASDPRFKPTLVNLIAQIEGLGLNVRETLHLDALKLLIADQDAREVLENLQDRFPHDILALRINHYLHFYFGGASDMRNSVARNLSHWQGGDPYYGYLLGMYAFGLEESGQYDEAEQYGKDAINYHNQDIWAAHAVAHVFQMTGRFEEGNEWIDRLTPGWDGANNFRFHLYWHNALFYLGQGKPELALEIYNQSLEGAIEDDFYLDTCNAAALLWRLKMLGLEVDDRFQALQNISAKRVSDNDLIFSTLHYLMAPALINDEEAVNACLANIREWATHDSPQGEVCRDVGLTLANAICDLSRNNYGSAATQLRQISGEIYRIGGSDAQRQLFSQMQSYAEAKSS